MLRTHKLQPLNLTSVPTQTAWEDNRPALPTYRDVRKEVSYGVNQFIKKIFWFFFSRPYNLVSNKPRTPIFDFYFSEKKCAGYSRKYGILFVKFCFVFLFVWRRPEVETSHVIVFVLYSKTIMDFSFYSNLFSNF